MTAPDVIAPNEELGRDVFSKRDRNRAQRLGKVRPNVFQEKAGNPKISVNRLDYLSEEEAASLGDVAAANRAKKENRKCNFYGWAVVGVSKAVENQRRVVATPQVENMYHADIILPDLAALAAEEQKTHQKIHAQQLADVSSWRDRPNPP